MKALQERIAYRFRNENLLTLALTHPSLAGKDNNQRLEFLGDAVLGTLVAHLLYTMYPTEQEGDLARRYASLVRGSTITQVAQDIGLGEALKMAAGEAQAGGRTNPTNLEDALEALIGALYIDGGIDAAAAFVKPRWQALAQTGQAPPKDAKTALQEWAQGKGLPLPTYTLLKTDGLAHAPVFTIEVTVKGYAPVQASAISKRAAEQAAAELLLNQLDGSV